MLGISLLALATGSGSAARNITPAVIVIPLRSEALISPTARNEVLVALVWKPDTAPPHSNARIIADVERQSAPPQSLSSQLPRLNIGRASLSLRRKREMIVTQDCWRLTMRAFSKIELNCSAKF